MKTWYKKAQSLYRGDPNPIDFDNFDVEYGRRELGKDLGSSSAWGPGIYFADKEDVARLYGSNITTKGLLKANILTPQSPRFTSRQIDKILNGVEKERLVTAIENWDENPQIGRRLLVNSICGQDNSLEQLMSIWADVFYHQNPNEFINLMVRNGIDGISITKDDVTFYVIYNKEVLK